MLCQTREAIITVTKYVLDTIGQDLKNLLSFEKRGTIIADFLLPNLQERCDGEDEKKKEKGMKCNFKPL